VTHVQFRILERFKGSPGDDMSLALSPSSAEFSYVKGQRVLVYTNRVADTFVRASPRGAWSTQCTRTRQVSLSDSELLVLRALHDNRPGGFIDGYVQIPEPLQADRPPDFRVVVRRDGAVVSETRADAAGRFRTKWLAPGKYVLSVQRPSPGPENRREVVVSAESRCIRLDSIVDR